jgi:hypothetical protein
MRAMNHFDDFHHDVSRGTMRAIWIRNENKSMISGKLWIICSLQKDVDSHSTTFAWYDVIHILQLLLDDLFQSETIQRRSFSYSFRKCICPSERSWIEPLYCWTVPTNLCSDVIPFDSSFVSDPWPILFFRLIHQTVPCLSFSNVVAARKAKMFVSNRHYLFHQFPQNRGAFLAIAKFSIFDGWIRIEFSKLNTFFDAPLYFFLIHRIGKLRIDDLRPLFRF